MKTLENRKHTTRPWRVALTGLAIGIVACEQPASVTAASDTHTLKASEVTVSRDIDPSEKEIVDSIVQLFPLSHREVVRKALVEDRVGAIGGDEPKLKALLEKHATLRAARRATPNDGPSDPLDSADPEIRRRDKERLMHVTIALVASLEKSNDRVAVTSDPSDYRTVLIRIKRDGATSADIEAGLALARRMAEGIRTGVKPNNRAASIRATSRAKGTELADDMLARLLAATPKALPGFGLAPQIQGVMHSKNPRKP